MSETRISWAAVDPVGEALQVFRMSGAFYCHSELSAPWALTMPPMEGCLWFHMVSEGAFSIESGEFKPQRVSSGDFALIPHGDGHILRTSQTVPAPVVTALPHEMVGPRYAHLRYGGNGAATTLVCGIVKFDHPSAADFVRLLPRVIRVETARDDWMPGMLRLMAEEARASRPGSEAIITRLADVLVIQAVRAWLTGNPESLDGLLGALLDPQIGRAVCCVHRDPCRQWDLRTLASEAAMSRTAFAARFAELVGEPPMHYVTRVKMHHAHALLHEGRATAGEVSSTLGYESEASFSRAFKRVTGSTPGAVKRRR